MTELAHGNGGVSLIVRRTTVMGTLADRYSMDPTKLLETIKATCIKGHASNEQVQAFLIVANRYDLDPFLKQIHAFADRGGGIVPIVGIDGWTKIINDQNRFDGMDAPVFVEGGDGKPISCTVTIYVKDRGHPVTITEYYAECYRNTPPWNQMPRRMLRHRAIMQCARVAFGLGGIYDEDEAKDIIAGDVGAATSLNAKVATTKASRAAKSAAMPAPELPDTQLGPDEANAYIEQRNASAPDTEQAASSEPVSAGPTSVPPSDAAPTADAEKTWPEQLPDIAHLRTDWIDDVIPYFKGSRTANQARKSFHALDVLPWAKLTPERRQEKYHRLIGGTIWT